MSWFGLRGGDCAFDVELALATVIEQTERCIAALLDLRNDEPGANCVNRSGWHEKGIICHRWLPHDQISDRAVFHGFPQLLLSEALLQAEGNLGAGSRTEDVPGFGFAVRQSHRPRKHIVRMDLDGKRFAREKKLEQERGIWKTPGGSFVPEFADRDAVVPSIAPGRQIDDTPGSW